VSTGFGGAAVIEKVTVPLVPPAVVTLTARSPGVAPASMVKVAVSCVNFPSDAAHGHTAAHRHGAPTVKLCR